MDLAISTGAQGLMWAILSLGVFLSFRILDVPDMTCEGSFPLGGAIAATMVVAGVSPWLAIVAAVIGGMVAGAVTGILYTKLKIPAILAGILTMIALYSINLHVMGKANVSLLRTDTIFRLASRFLDCGSSVAVMVGSVIYRVIIAVVLYMGMEPNDLKLFTAVVVVLALSMPLIKTHIAAGREG